MGYNDNIFVNCPFDKEYQPLLRALLFTILYAGKTPRIATERFNSAENRIDKICELISESQYGIHDLSRLQAEEPDEIFRLNMPFELGIDFGTRKHGERIHANKRLLILETELYEYQKAISDLSGVDIKSHEDEARNLVRAVRNWLYQAADITDIASPLVIWSQYMEFQTYLFETTSDNRLSDEQVAHEIDLMPDVEYVDHVHHWISDTLNP